MQPLEPGEIAFRLADAGDLWAVDQTSMQAILARSYQPRAKAPVLHAINGDTAVVSVRGVMVPGEGDGYEETVSTVQLKDTVRKLTADETVSHIVFAIDSPGGNVRGLHDLVSAIEDAGRTKDTSAYVEWQAMSAAYDVAAATGRIHASSRDAQIGSIGTILSLYDYSALLEKVGIKPVVIASGPLKGTGVFGTSLSDEQKVWLQEMVDGYAADFKSHVKARRKLSADGIETVSTGRWWRAEDARQLGLVDAVGGMADMLAEVKGTRRRKQVEAIAAIKAACPGASSDFVLAQVEAGATPDQAKAAWVEERAKQVSAQEATLAERETAVKAREEAVAAKEAVVPTPKRTSGTPVLSDGGPDGALTNGTATQRFNAAVDEKIKGGMTMAKALSAVNKELPALRQEMITEANAAR